MRFKYALPGRNFTGWTKLVAWRHHHPHTVGPLVATLLLLLVFGVVQLFRQDFYTLDPASQAVVGPVNAELTKKLTFDKAKQLYQFNKDAVTSGAPDSPQAALAAAQKSQKAGGGADNYAVDLAADSQKGVTIHDTTDTTGSLGISLTPLFETRSGKLNDGRVVYPLKGVDGQLVYTVKANGLKEDIVISTAEGNELSFSYRLKLPANLEARLLSNGALGIYSADPTLFGNISFGSDTDRQKVEAARLNGAKNHLVFAIPAPVIAQTGQGSDEVRAYFELEGDKLTVQAKGLAKASYPLSIDPSVVVTSANDFLTGNPEGNNIEFDTGNNQIKRTALTGGTVSTWTDVTQSMGQRKFHATVVYNDKLYVIGGCSTYSGLAAFGCSSVRSDVAYATLNSNGTLSAFTAVNSLPQARTGHGAAVYNGYVYVVAGFNNTGTTGSNTVYYAKINTDGTLGTWNLTTAVLDNVGGVATVAHNGYLYMLGGSNGAFEMSEVQYAPINADGTVGSWANTTSYGTAGWGHSATVYNGYLYVMGGCDAPGALNCGTYSTNVQYAPFNSDGTVGTWTSATSLPSARVGHISVAYGGYLYVMGGCGAGTATCSSTLNDVRYAPINADGSIGSWSRGPDFSGTGRSFIGGVAYKNYLYVNGGTPSSQSGNALENTSSGPIDPAGVTSSSTTSTAVPTVRSEVASVAYNGYLYVLGGWAGLNNTVYYAPLNADGSIGTWNTTASLTTSLYENTVVAYNGYLYSMGGCTAADACQSRTNNVQYAQVNSNGTLGAWTNATSLLPEQRGTHAAVVYNGYLYVLGGCIGTGTSCATNQTATVLSGTIGSNGDVTAWASANGFTGARNSFAAAVAHGRIYITAGAQASGEIQSVLICNGQNNGVAGCSATPGTLGTWTTTGMTATPVNTLGSDMEFYNGYLYIVGGQNQTGGNVFISNIYFAPVNNDGTVGAWQTTASLNTPRTQHGTALYNGVLYVSAGVNSSSSQIASTEYFRINNGGPGMASAWTPNVGFTTARFVHTSVAYNGYIYVLGGHDGTAATSNVQYAPINANGSIGTWASATNLTTARYLHTSVVYRGYLYAIGGFDGAANLNQVLYAPINANGTLGAWTPTTAFTTARRGHTSVVHNGYLYVVGGTTGSNLSDVQYASINPNGTVGTWNTTTALPSGRNGHASVAVNGYLYVTGGFSSAALGEVLYAPINANGTIGTWGVTRSFAPVRSGHTVAVANGYMYISGGCSAGGCTTWRGDTLYAAINSDGSLGEWTAAAVSLDRYSHSAVAYNGYLYLLGGCISSTCGGAQLTNNVQYTGLQSIPRIGRYSYLLDLGADITATKLLYRGSLTGGALMTLGARGALSAGGVFGSASTFPGMTPEGLASLPASEGRYRYLTFTFDDSGSGVFPDANSTRTTMTDFELFYNSAPSKRLRGGKTFTNQLPTGLNTNPN